jgi:glycosyltransferase involved in cell wall biosynthesis
VTDPHEKEVWLDNEATADSATLPRLSVVIPCFNDAETLGAQLEALARQEYDGWFEVIVADNGSTDDSPSVADRYRSKLPRLRVVDASGVRGAGRARNVGAAAAVGDALLFCDADDEVGAGWLKAMGHALQKHDFVASRHEIERLNEPSVQRTRRLPPPGEPLPYPPYLPHAGGSGLGVRRELFTAVGGFDESFIRLQDTDFCVRVQLAGTPLVFPEGAVVHCRYETRWLEIFRQARSYAEGNARLLARHGSGQPNRRGWWKWPLRHWLAIAKAAATAWDPGARARLAWTLGWQVGRIRGTLRYHVPAV